MAHKAITIILISNKYYQLGMQYKSISMNFVREKYICSTVKDMKVQCFGYFAYKDLLRNFPFEMPNSYIDCTFSSRI